MRTRRVPRLAGMAVAAITLIALTANAFAAPRTGPRRMTGEVLDVNPEAMSLIVSEEIGNPQADRVVFIVEPDAVVRIHGMKGKLDQLKNGDIVTVTFESREGRHHALEIHHM